MTAKNVVLVKLAQRPPAHGPGFTMRRALLITVAMAVLVGAMNLAPGFVDDVSWTRDLHFIQLRNSLQSLTDGMSGTLRETHATRIIEHDFANDDRPAFSGSSSSNHKRGSGGGGGGTSDNAGGSSAQSDRSSADGSAAGTHASSDAEPDDAAAAAAAAERERRSERRWRPTAEELEPADQPHLPATTSQTAGSSSTTIGSTKELADKFHVVMTSGSGNYNTWQSRMHYYFYKKVKAKDPSGAMGGFTRLLHSGQPDEFMDEIPTVVVDPLPADLQQVANGYIVLDRPYAFKQWVERHAHTIPERFILMAEPDHILLRPMPLLATDTRPAAYSFFYIEPQKYAHVLEKFNYKRVSIDQFDPVGNSPVMINKHQFASFVDLWVNVSLAIKADEEADKAWGWVQEMYAYAIAAAQAPEGPARHTLVKEFMLQPPWDASLEKEGKPAYIIHFTYGNDFDEAGQFTPGKVGHWHWDKRDFYGGYPRHDTPMPPEGCTNEAVKRLIASVNEAASNIPGWKELEAPPPKDKEATA